MQEKVLRLYNDHNSLYTKNHDSCQAKAPPCIVDYQAAHVKALTRATTASAKDIVLVVDTQGIFWTMGQENPTEKEIQELWSFDREPREFRVNVIYIQWRY